jgi:hypothetical protein
MIEVKKGDNFSNTENWQSIIDNACILVDKLQKEPVDNPCPLLTKVVTNMYELIKGETIDDIISLNLS